VAFPIGGDAGWCRDAGVAGQPRCLPPGLDQRLMGDGRGQVHELFAPLCDLEHLAVQLQIVAYSSCLVVPMVGPEAL